MKMIKKLLNFFYKEKPKTQYEILNERVKFFEQNIDNYNLIYDEGGELPIDPGGIGEIKKTNNNIIEIEFRQIGTRSKKEGGAWYDLPYYAKGVLSCFDCEYTISEITDFLPSFYLYREDDKRLTVLIGRNNKGIKIKCNKIEVKEFKEIEIGIDSHRKMADDVQSCKFFKINIV